MKIIHRYGFAIGVARLFIASALPGSAQITETDGDWSSKTALLVNTPQAELMVRVGDIDNLGFKWPAGFDPFSGNSTPAHGFPWTPDPADPDGTDRMMVISSYKGTPPAGSDGYSRFISRPDNDVRPIVLDFSPVTGTVRDTTLQIFVDDFQAPVWHAIYQVTINDHPVPALEDIINRLIQTGSVGKLITVPLPSELLPEVRSGHLKLVFDDATTGAGDGYAIDFVKLLVNGTGQLQKGGISGQVVEFGTGRPLPNVTVSAFDQEAMTDNSGNYTLNDVPAGLALATAAAGGFEKISKTVDVIAGQVTPSINFLPRRGLLFLSIYTAVELEFFGYAGSTHVLQYSGDLYSWADDEMIPGEGKSVVRFRSTRDPARRFWRVSER